jgi:muconate cycloisomerase
MKITEIRTHLLAIPLRERYHWAIGAPEGFNAVLVEVHTDNGIVGYGDALGTRSAVAAEATIRSVEALLIGEDPFRVECLLGRFYHSGAWSNQRRFANQSFAGIEMALWDICGKALGQPVYNLLGGKVRDTIHWFGFLQGGDPQALAEDARQHVARGFDLLYMKIGQGAERDLAAVRAVREAVGDGPRLRVDPNEAWDRHTAVTMIRQLEPFNLDWVEQPLPAGDIAGAADLRRQVSVPLALDQALFTDAEVLEAVRRDACDVVVIGFHETGGLLPLKKAAVIAAAGSLNINRHGCLGETGISTLAALQVLATIPNLSDGNQVMHQLCADDVLVDGLLDIEGGTTVVPDRPGLGIEINWDHVERFEKLFEQVGQYPM